MPIGWGGISTDPKLREEVEKGTRWTKVGIIVAVVFGIIGVIVAILL